MTGALVYSSREVLNYSYPSSFAPAEIYSATCPSNMFYIITLSAAYRVTDAPGAGVPDSGWFEVWVENSSHRITTGVAGGSNPRHGLLVVGPGETFKVKSTGSVWYVPNTIQVRIEKFYDITP